jgi:N6-adenosine-specific RNA methylase IME4/ParB-like chromosome segregation protein Spo0J
MNRKIKVAQASTSRVINRTMTASMKAHQLAELFPLLEGEEFDALVSDIKSNGQREPIVLFEGKILDGRNRYRACLRTQIKPIFKNYRDNDPLAFVISLNLKRRHLNESQRAWVASKIANLPRGGQSEEPANLPVSPKVAQADAATLLNVSPRSIRSAAAIRDLAEPEIQRAVEQGLLSLNLGVQAFKLTKADQRKIASRAETGGNVKAMFRELTRAKDEVRVRSLAPVAGRFSTLVIDPPWEHSAPVYATMTQEQLRAIDVPQWARDNCALYLWTTNSAMECAIELMAHWGFERKNILTWVKPCFGRGYYFRNSTEHVLFGTRGNVKARRADIPTHFEAPAIGQHSTKPETFYELVRVASYPPYGEIFQREKRADFTNLYQSKKSAQRYMAAQPEMGSET